MVKDEGLGRKYISSKVVVLFMCILIVASIICEVFLLGPYLVM